MKLKCAWCEREGRPASVGDVEPIDNRADTHGVCEQHRDEWLTSLGLTPPPPGSSRTASESPSPPPA
jgi:hypothetical protein